MKLALGFAPLLEGHDLAELERRADTVFGLTPDRRLGYVNPAYDRFARENGAEWGDGMWDIGCSIDPAIPWALRAFYDSLYEKAHHSGAPQEHDYECSSPTAIRKLRMCVYPLQPAGWLVVNAMVMDGLDPGPVLPPSTDYTGRRGVIVMCSHCRRTRRGDVEQWDWVPAWVSRPPSTVSHGLCPPCFAHHYPNVS